VDGEKKSFLVQQSPPVGIIVAGPSNVSFFLTIPARITLMFSPRSACM